MNEFLTPAVGQGHFKRTEAGSGQGMIIHRLC